MTQDLMPLRVIIRDAGSGMCTLKTIQIRLDTVSTAGWTATLDDVSEQLGFRTSDGLRLEFIKRYDTAPTASATVNNQPLRYVSRISDLDRVVSRRRELQALKGR